MQLIKNGHNEPNGIRILIRYNGHLISLHLWNRLSTFIPTFSAIPKESIGRQTDHVWYDLGSPGGFMSRIWWPGDRISAALSVLFYVITYSYLYFCGSLAKLQLKLWHYISQIYVDVITNPLSKLSAPLTNSCLQTRLYINGLVQDCSNSSALAMELLQPCPKPSIFGVMGFFVT